MESDLVDKEFDCFGWMYNRWLVTCNSKCAVRFSCKERVTKRLHQLGKEKFESEKRKVMIANREEMQRTMQRDEKTRRTLEPQMSTLVSGLIEMMRKFGLSDAVLKAHLAFKIEGRNIFGVTAFKAKDLRGLLKVIYTRDRAQFPEQLLPHVTTEPVGGFYCIEADSLEELEPLVKIYLEHITGEQI